MRGGLPFEETFEESPDITGQGGRETDPGKPAGKCHRKHTAQARDPHVRPRDGKVEKVR